MLFNTRLFLYFFLPSIFVFFYLFSKLRLLKLCHLWLIFASAIFYIQWKHSHLDILILSICLNYGAAFLIRRRPESSWMLPAGIAANVLLLAIFKYRNFLLSNILFLYSGHYDLQPMHLPLGISFYTFTQIAYLVDVYKRKTKSYSILEYTLFVTFFPHLIAGPIVHYSQIMPQFESLRKRIINYENAFKGIFYLVLGLAAKVLIADRLAPIADYGFQHAAGLSLFEAWKALLAYTFQLYFDFSGYSNMAIGLALLFNIRFPANFNSPYQATSIIDFWRRWHMTLSQFLKQYVYIPLGGNRCGESRQYWNIFITLLIGGIWHGAGWTFVLWGIYNGILVILNHVLLKAPFTFPQKAAKALTFLLITYGRVFFRSTDLHQVMFMSQSLFGFHGLLTANTILTISNALAVLGIAAAGCIALFLPNAQWWEKTIPSHAGKWVMALAVLFALCYDVISKTGIPHIFIYWTF